MSRVALGLEPQRAREVSEAVLEGLRGPLPDEQRVNALINECCKYSVPCSADFLGSLQELPFFLSHLRGSNRKCGFFFVARFVLLRPLSKDVGGHHADGYFLVLPSLGNARLLLCPACQDRCQASTHPS
jgi:hypothetical protein